MEGNPQEQSARSGDVELAQQPARAVEDDDVAHRRLAAHVEIRDVKVALPVRRNAFWVRSAGRQRGEGDCGASIPGLGHKREGTQEQRYEKSLQGMRAFHDRISSITCR